MPTPKAAVGFSIHTGWAAAVVLAGPPPRVVARYNVQLAKHAHDARFVYHVAQQRPGSAAAILKRAEATARKEAVACLKKLVTEFSGFELLVALPHPKRALPTLSAILVSHPLIHNAESELFRRSVADAATTLSLHVAIVQPGRGPPIRGVGPPWGKDQKDAAALAWAALQTEAGAKLEE